jgi:hypothetical protein
MAEQLNIDIIARDKSKQALNSVQGNISKLKNSVFNLRNALIAVGAGAVIKGFFDAGIQVETLGVQLKTLFGSAQEGEKALRSITKFAAGTPFELKNIQQGVTSLAVVRKNAEEAGLSFEDLLTITGNVAAQLGGDFALASFQIQKAFSVGIASAETLKDRGVAGMAGFKAGVSVNAKDTIKIMNAAFGRGGKFGNLMAELSKTLFGTISNLRDAFFIFQVEVSKGFFTALKNNLGDLKKTVEENSQQIAEFGLLIGSGFSKVINGTAKSVKFLKDNIDAIAVAFRIFIALKVVSFFYNLAVAIGVANGAMLGFNATVRKNLLIVGGAILLSQLDKIVKKFKEFTGIKGKKNEEELIEELPEVEVPKPIPEANALDKLKFQFEVFKETIRSLSEEELKKFDDKFKSIGETIATGMIGGLKKVSESIARSVVLGENLLESFRALAQQILINILSALIEQVAIMAIMKLFKKEEIEKEAEKDNLIRKQNTNLKRQIALQAILMAMGGGGGGGSGLFQGGFGGARASGGTVSKGQPYLVGERGAELFIPNSTGQIAQSARGMGSGQTTVNFNINTLDARGFDELLVRNRGTITQIINSAVNERGAKSLI